MTLREDSTRSPTIDFNGEVATFIYQPRGNKSAIDRLGKVIYSFLYFFIGVMKKEEDMCSLAPTLSVVSRSCLVLTHDK